MKKKHLFQMAPVINPRGSDTSTILNLVRKNGVVIFEGFPTDPEMLLRAGCLLGTPQHRYVWNPLPAFSEPMKWVTDVRFKPTIKGDEAQLFTHRCGDLRLHTARASFKAKPRDTPRLFMMLMADPGSPSATVGAGASRFSRLADAINCLKQTIDDERKVVEILRILKTTPISTEDPYPHIPVTAPIMSGGSREVMRFRYWEHILDHARSTPAFHALSQFDEALTKASFEYSLRKGDLVLIDNHRVAHGRRGFDGWLVDSGGNKILSSRLLYNLHVFID